MRPATLHVLGKCALIPVLYKNPSQPKKRKLSQKANKMLASICKSLNGKEQLPKIPLLLSRLISFIGQLCPL